jgi:hypothetical protein
MPSLFEGEASVAISRLCRPGLSLRQTGAQDESVASVVEMSDCVDERRSPEDKRVLFAACRAEILGRSAHQHTLLSINLTALAALAGVVLSGHADERLLLLLPIISGSIGLMWYDHARNIDSLGDFIRQDLVGFGGYEKHIAALEKSEWRRVPMTAALLLLFVAAPIAGLVIPIHRVDGWLWVLWGVGVILSVACSVAFITWMVEGFRD